MSTQQENKYIGKHLTINFTDKHIEIEFDLIEKSNVQYLVLKSILTDRIIEYKIEQNQDKYYINIEHRSIENINLIDTYDDLSSLNKIKLANNKIECFDLHLKCGDINLDFGTFEKIKINDNAFNINNNVITFIENENNVLQLGINVKNNLYFKEKSVHVKTTKTKVMIDGVVETNNMIEDFSIVLCGKKKLNEIKLEPLVYKTTKKRINKYTIKYNMTYDNHSIKINFIEDTYEVFIKIKVDGIYQYFRQSRVSLLERIRVNPVIFKFLDNVIILSPHFTYNKKKMSFEIIVFKQDVYDYLIKKIQTRYIDRIINYKRDVWLIAEHTNKAQDNGYRFFKYMRENYPDKEVYYVIEKSSKDFDKVNRFGNVLEFRSKKHIEYSLLASKFISSHHYDLMLPINDDWFRSKIRGTRIFLQHGVLGTKHLVKLYGDKIKSFTTDAFIVSSEKEKDIVINDFKYEESMVKVTGLARFDSLFEPTIQENQILIIPTWRNWLQNLGAFTKSEYFETYKNLLTNTKFLDYASKNNLKIVFCLHPNMQQYSHLFESKQVKVVNQGEVDVQDLIKSSKLMISDYSSVCFDFAFLNKPVIYYMFDRERFFENTISHYNLDQDLPGKIVVNENQLVESIINTANNDFKVDDEYQKRAQLLLKYHDQNNCKRIKEVIENTKRNNSLKRKLKKSILIEAFINKLSKNKKYKKLIKKLIPVFKLMPIKNNSVVIESGMSKTFNDSPAAIYEQLKVTHPDLKKFIVYDGLISGIDRNTKVIKRLSLRYFYELSRAKYWINNQNYPYYMKKRSKTIYLQTWHGTPLKKMFHDLNEFYGRDKGYKSRNMQAIEQWTHLLIPNEYSMKCFNSAFKHNAINIENGYPRNDALYKNNNSAYKLTVKNKLHLPENKKIILYTPTFRDDVLDEKGKFNYDLKIDFEKLVKSLKDDSIILVRLHLIVSSNIVIPKKYENIIFDVSNYHSVEDLMLISDVLVTDYSSIFFDYLNLEKPIIFYAYDLDHYASKIRGFYLDYTKDNLPGPILTNEDELYTLLEDIDDIKNKYAKRINEAKQLYTCNDNENSTLDLIKKIFK